MSEQQLQNLRDRVKNIRIARHWLQEYQINAPTQLRSALAQYSKWLTEQEQKTIELGRTIKNQTQHHG